MQRSAVVAMTLGWAAFGVALVSFLYELAHLSESCVRSVML